MERNLTEWISARIIESRLIAKIGASLDKLMWHCLGTPRIRPLKVFLNGTWVGHPLHPMLTDIPIGAWTLTILLDLTGLLFGFSQLGLASGITACIGVLGALAAAAAGLADWMDIDPPEKAIGAFHASVNVSATILFLISFFMRWGRHWQFGWAAFVVALTGYLLVALGGYLGGALVFYKGVMINRNAYRTGPDDFKPAVATSELADGQCKRVLVEQQPILFLKLDGTVYALGAVCSHYGAPLNDGKIVERTIECPWHASRFALEDGRVVQGPACAGVPVYDCKIVGDQVQIKQRK
jgi:nitrite reductase/ring-hydroxylating ferredoxin subunit/uncharacterized membrane protein